MWSCRRTYRKQLHFFKLKSVTLLFFLSQSNRLSLKVVLLNFNIFYLQFQLFISLITCDGTLRKSDIHVSVQCAYSEYVSAGRWPPLKFLTAATSPSNRIFQLHSHFFPSSFKHRLSRLDQLKSNLHFQSNIQARKDIGSLFYSLH